MDTRHTLSRPSVVAGRVGRTVELAKGRRVLHVGCVDAGLVEDRMARSALLHPQLAAVASHIVGVDIDEDGLEILRGSEAGELAKVDVCVPGWCRLLPSTDFELVVASEVLEHLYCPAVFLQGVLELARGRELELLLTVPSAFSIRRLLGLLRNREVVHPDHVAYYSPVTVSRLLTACGFEVRELLPYSFQTRGVGRPVGHVPAGSGVVRRRGSGLVRKARRAPALLAMAAVFRISPWWAEGIMVVAVPAKSGGSSADDLD